MLGCLEIMYFNAAGRHRSITHTSVWSVDSQDPSVGHLQEELRAACQTLPVTRRHGPASVLLRSRNLTGQ